MQFRAALTISAVLLASAGGITPALAARVAAPPSGIGIQLLDAPASARADPRAHMYVVDQLHNGSVIVRHVRVSNLSGRPVTVSLYSAAASISGGTFGFAANRTANELTSWTSVTPRTAALAPGHTADATVRITVPPNVTTGERYAVIWAQAASSAAPGTTQEINRVGVRMYIDVAGNVQPSDFAIESISGHRDATGIPRITVGIRNTGKRAVDISGTIALSNGPGGLKTGPIRTDSTVTLAPGQSGTTTATFDRRLQPGPWLGTISLASGLIAHTATATITFTTGAAVIVKSAGHHETRWWLWLVVAGALALLMIVFVLRRSRRSGRSSRSGGASGAKQPASHRRTG